MRQLTHGALFAGIGGFDLGFAWAGIKTLWDVEIDAWCQGQLKKNFPDTEIFGDIRDCGKENLKPVDIISGGFPCQPFSSAGKRRGAEDDRYLWPEMLRVIDEVRPAWVVGENVSGLGSMGFPISDIKVASRHITRYTDHDYYEGVLTQQERMYVDFICENFEGIDYDVQPFIIPAVGLGAKHLRRRIWFVAHTKTERCGKTRENFGRCEKRVAGSDHESLSDSIGSVGGSGAKRAGREAGANLGGCGAGTTLGHSGGERVQGIGAVGQQEPTASTRSRLSGRSGARSRAGEWLAEPTLGSLVDGLPAGLADKIKFREGERDQPIPRVTKGTSQRVSQLKGYGNAILPQHAEVFGNMIVEIERMMNA